MRRSADDGAIGTAGPLAMIRLMGCSLAAIILLSCTAHAAPTECRFINSRKERNACYERQNAERLNAAKQAPNRTRREDTLEHMKMESDQLNKRLKGICRGC